MFNIRSWTEESSTEPYRATCECKAEAGFASERERWIWIQQHVCGGPLRVFYLDQKRKAKANA